jgi:hypothetical protein
VSNRTAYINTDFEKIPKDPAGRALLDVFVHMPSSNRYVRMICAGDEIDLRKQELIKTHSDPAFYLVKTEADTPPEVLIIKGNAAKVEEEKAFIVQNPLLTRETESELRQTFQALLDPTEPPDTVIQKLEAQASKVLDAVAPETKDLRAAMMKNMAYIRLMNESSAITSIAVLVALANGFDSKKSYKDLSYACLVMDASLAEFTNEELDEYYRLGPQTRPELWSRIRKHPARSHDIAQSKLRSISDVGLQLILNHHELYNGKGYPRGMRSESLFPMVRVLSLSVDIFEHMKRFEMRGEQIDFLDAVIHYQEVGVEPHLRRHSKAIVEKTLNFLQLNPETIEAPAKS